MWIKLVRDAVIVLGVFGLVWYIFTMLSSEKTLNGKVLSDSQIEQIGDWIAAEVEKKYPPLRNKNWDSLLEEMQLRMESAKPDYKGKIKLMILDEAQPNAFATLGGRIYIFRGIVEMCDTPEELYGILAHEFGHVYLNHVERKLITEFGLAILLSAVGSGDVLLSSEIIRILGSGAFSRVQEQQADDFALNLMLETGVDPGNLGIMFRKLSEYSGDSNSLFELLSTHPDTRKRIQKAHQFDKSGLEEKPFENTLSSEE